MRNWDDKDIKAFPTQHWVILLCGFYAEKKLQEMYDLEGKLDKHKYNNIRISSICSDKRRTNTVRKHLESLNLVQTSYYTDADLVTVDEEIEKLLKGFSKEPEFHTSGYIKEKDYYSDDKVNPVTNIGDLYRDIYEFSASEIIHVYLNHAQYNFKMFKTTSTYRSRKTSYQEKTHVRYDLKIFPLAALDKTDEVALLANNETYAKAHANAILSYAFDLNFIALDNKKPYFTVEDLETRIQQVKDKQRVLRRTLAELSVLKRKAETLKDSYKDTILNSSLNYVRRRAPIWINDKEADASEKTLAKMCLKGTSLSTEKFVHR